jgi:hypothetical protein
MWNVRPEDILSAVEHRIDREYSAEEQERFAGFLDSRNQR